MKKFIKIVDKVIEYIQWAFIAAMAYFAILSLLEWWGHMWVIAIGVFIAIVLVIIPVIYRLLRGKWPVVEGKMADFLHGIYGVSSGMSRHDCACSGTNGISCYTLAC